MKYNGTIYRPPLEASTFLVPITEGCTHNSCTFCNMYRDAPFRMLPLDDVEAYLREMAAHLGAYAERIMRVYLVGADPFALSANRLLERIALVKKHLPRVNAVSMYARTDNIARKSDDDLRRLREAGVDDLYVGVECGLDDVLESLGKGYTAGETREQCLRLNAAGIHHCDLLMLGTAGNGRGGEVARATALLENEIKPSSILVNTMTAFVGTELDEDVQTGGFVPAGEREVLQEEHVLLEALELPDTYYWAIHPLDSVGIEGLLGTDKNRMLNTLEKAIDEVDESAYRRVSRTGTL